MGLSLRRLSVSIVFVIAMCCAPSLTLVRAETIVPTIEELVETIDSFHGPCGHTEGVGKLSGALIELAMGGYQEHSFTAFIVECETQVVPEFTDTELLISWLATYDHHALTAWDRLEVRQHTKLPIPAMMRRAALIMLLNEDAYHRDTIYLPLLRKDAEAAEKRLAFQIAEGKYPDPFARGFGTELDVLGTYYRAIFAEVGILPICQTCPSEPRGTEGEQMWARVFLTIHARNLPGDPVQLMEHPTVAPWRLQFYEGETQLERAQAAVVLLRLLDIAEHASS